MLNLGGSVLPTKERPWVLSFWRAKNFADHSMVDHLKMAGEREIEHLALQPRDCVDVCHGLERAGLLVASPINRDAGP
jgi:hypothetical protein